MAQEWVIREESAADYQSIDAVIVAASGEHETAEIVRRLRNDGDVVVGLVAEVDQEIVGHIMMSQMAIETAVGRAAAVALAPLMVTPAWQNKGIGSALTREALSACTLMGQSIVIVVGHPSYYPRFGFSAQLAQGIDNPFSTSVPGPFMALELKQGSLQGLVGRVKYPRAFSLTSNWTL